MVWYGIIIVSSLIEIREAGLSKMRERDKGPNSIYLVQFINRERTKQLRRISDLFYHHLVKWEARGVVHDDRWSNTIWFGFVDINTTYLSIGKGDMDIDETKESLF